MFAETAGVSPAVALSYDGGGGAVDDDGAGEDAACTATDRGCLELGVPLQAEVSRLDALGGEILWMRCCSDCDIEESVMLKMMGKDFVSVGWCVESEVSYRA